MAMLDFTWVAYYMAIFGFLLVFVVVYAILASTKIFGESNNAVNLIIAFIFAIIFITFSPGVQYVQAITPWFIILVICLFFFMIIVAFSKQDLSKFMKPWIAWVFLVLLLLIFLIAAINVFNPILAPYLPGSGVRPSSPAAVQIVNFIYSEKFLGAVAVLIIAIVASWVLTRKGK